MLEGIAFIAYSVADVPRAVAFYRDVVGLQPGELQSDRWTEFSIGDVAFGLGDGRPLGIEPGSACSLALEVDDVRAERDRYVKAGVTVTDVNESPVCWSCFATDPDGNRFALHQRKPR